MQPEHIADQTVEKAFHTPHSMVKYVQEVFDGEYAVLLDGAEINSVLDVGANVGAFTAWALSNFPNATVQAYEPNPKAIEYWRKNVTDPRATLHEVAVTVQRDAHLYSGTNNLGEASVHKGLADCEDLGAIQTLLPDRLPKADFVKLDCEGCEAEFIADSREAYQHKPKVWALEYHSGYDRDTIKGALHWEYDLVRAEEYVPGVRGLQIWRRKDVVKEAKMVTQAIAAMAVGDRGELCMRLAQQIERIKGGFALPDDKLARVVAQLDGLVIP